MKRSRRDDGAVLIVVAAFCLVAVLFAAFVIDIGNQRQNRRQLTTGTDAPALAVAQEWVAGGALPIANDTAANTNDECSWTNVDNRLAAENNPTQSQMPETYSCFFDSVTPYRGGIVSVRSREGVDLAFGGATGVQQTSVGSLTRVRVQPIPGGNLRPIAFCQGDFDRSGWTHDSANGVWTNPSPATSTVVFTNVRGNGTSPCRVQGNWSQVVFREPPQNTCPGQSNPGNAGANDFKDQYENGTEYDIAVNDCVSRVPGNGALTSMSDSQIRSFEGQIVSFPVFDDAVGGGAGIYKVTGFLEARVLAVNAAGNTRSFVLQPLRYFTKGTCCLLNESNMQITICDVGTIGGAPADTSSTDCQPRNTSGNPLPPGVSDPCIATELSPQPLNARVSGEDLQGDVIVNVTVRDSTAVPCGTLTLDAVTDSPARRVTAELLGRSGDVYSFRFRDGTRLASVGTTFRLEVLKGADLLDDDGVMNTIAGCVVTAPTTVNSPVNGTMFLTRTGSQDQQLAEEIVFTVTVSDRATCSLTGRLVHPQRTDNPLLLVSDGPTLNTVRLTAPVGATNYKPPTSNSASWTFQLVGAASPYTSPTVTIGR